MHVLCHYNRLKIFDSNIIFYSTSGGTVSVGSLGCNTSGQVNLSSNSNVVRINGGNTVLKIGNGVLEVSENGGASYHPIYAYFA